MQGATMAEWSMEQREAKTGYVLLDTTIEYNKGICTGFDWMFPKAGGDIVGRDTFKNNDASINTCRFGIWQLLGMLRNCWNTGEIRISYYSQTSFQFSYKIWKTQYVTHCNFMQHFIHIS